MNFFKKSKINISKNIIILISITFIVLIFSIIMFKLNYPNSHRTFFFERMDNKGLTVEKRYVPIANGSDKITAFVEELLLGPIETRLRPVFPRGTKLLSCFNRDKTLYVNLSKDILKQDLSASKYLDGAKIFKKNIFKNFRNIDIIEIYIDGNWAYLEMSEDQL